MFECSVPAKPTEDKRGFLLVLVISRYVGVYSTSHQMSSHKMNKFLGYVKGEKRKKKKSEKIQKIQKIKRDPLINI